MGNKSKAVAIILGVVVFAVGIVSGALLAFKPRGLADTPVSNAASTVSTTSGQYYYVEIAGQQGYASNVKGVQGGSGAICYGFLKAAKSSYTYETNVKGGAAGMSSGAGGGLSSFEMINFALPAGAQAGTGIAGGGGGAGYYYISSGGLTVVASPSGGAAGFSTGSDGTATIITGNGYTHEGTSGSGGSSGSSYGGAGKAFGGGGGAGYYGGSGGGVDKTGNIGMWEGGGGGGGSCSPNLYWKGSNYRYQSTTYEAGAGGYVNVINLSTGYTAPTGATVNAGQTANLTAGTVCPNTNGTMFYYATSLNSTWSTMAPSGRTAAGTTVVYWRYCAKSSDNVIASGSVNLTVENAQGTVSAPTLTGNGSATYSGNDIQVVTAAGQSSGTFTFATVKTKDEE